MLTFVSNFISGHGYGPSYREIMRGLGYQSVATVALHIDSLIAKGYLRKHTHRARSLEVIDSGEKDYVPSKDKAPVSQEKWLAGVITRRFAEAEAHEKPSQQIVDELFVLVGALKVLGFSEAANAFIPRLTDLGKKNSKKV